MFVLPSSKSKRSTHGLENAAHTPQFTHTHTHIMYHFSVHTSKGKDLKKALMKKKVH
jgi:hypothetical protein